VDAGMLQDALCGSQSITSRRARTLMNNVVHEVLESRQYKRHQFPKAKVLSHWFYRYDLGSEGAPLFEKLYDALIEEAFSAALGCEGDGAMSWAALKNQTPVVRDAFGYLDSYMAREREWFGTPRTQVIDRALQRMLPGPANCANAARRLPNWRAHHRMKMHNAALGGRLGLVAWALGIDYGPLGVPGGRGTVFEARITSLEGREKCTGPVYRMVADLGHHETATVLAGGPSGHTGSKMYWNEVVKWRQCEYKVVQT